MESLQRNNTTAAQVIAIEDGRAHPLRYRKIFRYLKATAGFDLPCILLAMRENRQ